MKVVNILRLQLHKCYKFSIIRFFFFIISDGEYLFADPDSKLSKYGPKSWRSSHTHVRLKHHKKLLKSFY